MRSKLRKIMTAVVVLATATLLVSHSPVDITAARLGDGSRSADTPVTRDGVAHAAGTPARFKQLSPQASNRCDLTPAEVRTYEDDRRLQGACCTAMDEHAYREQVTGLRRYAHIPQIPTDPYDIRASRAKQLLEYREIRLTAAQRARYDRAMQLSATKGPCCCRCWRWDAFDGMARFLITRHDMQARELAKVIEFVEGCGGAGHEH